MPLYLLPEDYTTGSDFNDLLKDLGIQNVKDYLRAEFKNKELSAKLTNKKRFEHEK